MNDRRFPSQRNPGLVLIRPGADGHDNRRLFECLIKLLEFGDSANWFLHRKLEFASNEDLRIRSHRKGRITEARYLWPTRGLAMEWIER
jgi:hypothetical protein